MWKQLENSDLDIAAGIVMQDNASQQYKTVSCLSRQEYT